MADLSAHCPTCSAPITENLFCKRCAEVFIPLEDLQRGSPTLRETLTRIGPHEMKSMLRASVSWALLNDLYHVIDRCSCEKCYCGAPMPEHGMCAACGFIHRTLDELNDDPVNLVVLLQQARRRKIAYSLVNDMPAFELYGATDLSDRQQAEAAHARKWEHVRANLDELERYIKGGPAEPVEARPAAEESAEENDGHATSSRKERIRERFMLVGILLGLILGIWAIVDYVSEGGTTRPILALLIFMALGAGAGWLVGSAAAWMIGED